jgi:transposase-like protein
MSFWAFYSIYGNIIYVFWNRETLLKVIKNKIKTGIIIYGDQWKA